MAFVMKPLLLVAGALLFVALAHGPAAHRAGHALASGAAKPSGCPSGALD